MTKYLLAATAAAAFSATSATALTSFDFGGTSTIHDAGTSAEFTNAQGIKVTVTASAFDNSFAIDPNRTTASVTQNPKGIGVKNNAEENNQDTDGISAQNDNDVLIFRFSEAVNIGSVTFDVVSGDAAAGNRDVFYFSSVSDTSPVSYDIPPTLPTTIATLPLTNVTEFALGARDDDDEWVVTSFNDVSAVPLPASILFMAGGLGGFAAWARRKRA